ncbi:MAG: rod shape-determining protein RodA [Patescibacteria group bacterium]|nr:rod shape-determining protein RodA [Patescibacteria group bacterium]
MNRKSLWDIDWSLMLPVGVLVALSLVTLFSLNTSFFKSQLMFLVISIFAFIFFSQVNYKIIELYKTPIYIVSLCLLFLVLILGIESRGAVRWIEILGFRIQFSEILKPFLAISLSSYLVSLKNYSFKSVLNVILFLLPVAFLIFFQPDLGDALIFVAVTFLTLIFFGFPLRFFLAGIVSVLLLFPIFWNFLHDYQRQRVLTFLNPGTDPLGTSYNAIQSIIAVGSGMLIGKGFGQGTQSGLRFLPERHTDFIFATISEQLGFIGTVVIIAAFVFLLYRIYIIYQTSQDKFCKTFAATSFFIILMQFFINVGMNIGVIPIVGVTLPFMSYGGSSLLSNFIILGLLTAVNKSSKQEDILEIR